MRTPKHPPYRQRYNDLHFAHTVKRTPSAVADNLYPTPNFPKVETSNGLTQYIVNFINWSGYRATRINTMGRMVAGKWIHSTTRKGSADISATIPDKNGIGRTVMIEIKIKPDKPSIYQLEEQKKERQAGGIYEFISTPEEFLELFDSIVNK